MRSLCGCSIGVFISLFLNGCGGSSKAIPADVEIEWPKKARDSSTSVAENPPNAGEILTCTKAAAHIIGLIRSDIQRRDQELQEAASELLPGFRESLFQACEEDGWSQDAQHCILGATQVEQLYECKPVSLPDDSRLLLPPSN